DGTGTPFTVQGVIGAGGSLASVNTGSFTPGSYTVAPTVTPSLAPVSGGGLVGCGVEVECGIGTQHVSNAGAYTANPAGGNMTQGSTSGTGVGATFQSAIFGPLNLSVQVPGTYTTGPTNPAS